MAPIYIYIYICIYIYIVIIIRIVIIVVIVIIVIVMTLIITLLGRSVFVRLAMQSVTASTPNLPTNINYPY